MEFESDREAILEARRELVEEMLDGLPALIAVCRARAGRLHARLGLTAGQWDLLREIDRRAPVGIAELARLLGVSRQYVHRLGDELVRAGYVRLKPDPRDRRVRLIELTTAARARFDEEAARERAVERMLAAGFGTDELAVTVSVLARLADRLAEPTTETGSRVQETG
jgi:DNA-binding MarR family transcriptional regulator